MAAHVTRALPAILLGIVPLAVASDNPPPQETHWVAYTAEYHEFVASRDASGLRKRTVRTVKESRSGSGAYLKQYMEDGQIVDGQFWAADGQMYRLNYGTKKAYPMGKHPRRHPYVPPDTPLGSATVAGLQCTAYPVHMELGTGEICVDMNDDILVHLSLKTMVSGNAQDRTVELTSIQLLNGVDANVAQLPEGFTIVKTETGSTAH